MSRPIITFYQALRMRDTKGRKRTLWACHECGASVVKEDMQQHVDWHVSTGTMER